MSEKQRRRSSGSNKVVFSSDVTEAKMEGTETHAVPRHTTGSNLFRTNTEVKDYLDSDVITVKFRSIPRLLTDEQKKNGAGPDTGITSEGTKNRFESIYYAHANSLSNRNFRKMAS